MENSAEVVNATSSSSSEGIYLFLVNLPMHAMRLISTHFTDVVIVQLLK